MCRHLENNHGLIRVSQFRLGRSIVNATADLPRTRSPRNVLRLVNHHTNISTLLVHAASYLPRCAQDTVKRLWPGPFLPECVILKTKKPEPGWEEEWANERRMYDKLKDLQGSVIPVFYGDAEFNGKPALLLSYVAGPPLFEVSHLEVADVRRKLEEAFLPLEQRGVYQDDPKMGNLILADGDRLVNVDLEHVYEFDEPADGPYVTESGIQHIIRFYNGPKTK